MLFGRTTSNRVSRFVDEIPDEHIKKNIPRGYGYGEKSRIQSEFARKSPRQGRSPVAAPTVKAPAAPAKAPSFQLGDKVRHKAFGPGVINKLTPMGGDYLIEINFESAGTKKLMLRAAAQFMSKE